MKRATRLVHFNPCPSDPFRATATPIYLTATFQQDSAVEFSQYDYSRSGNPTRTVLEKHLADLEGAARAFCFASGLAAVTAVTRLVNPGDEILACADLYGGTCRLFSTLLKHKGIRIQYVAGPDLEGFRCAIGADTRLVYIETPTNPTLQIIDIAAAADLAHEHGALLCVDNTMMSPYFQNPLEHGADIVVHSATKSLAGHGDVTAGVVAVSDLAVGDEIYQIQNGEGAVLSPFDSYLLLRGLKTLGVRLDRQQSNAQRIAEFLAKHPAVQRVYYPGLVQDPIQASLQAQQARGNGSVVSFETGSVELSRQIVAGTRIFAITVSFGSVNSSISLPMYMSHASVPPAIRLSRALPFDLVRLSVGIEDADDLILDLEAALDKALEVTKTAVPGEAPQAKATGECQ